LPPFSTMRAEQLPAATVLHLTPPPGTLIALSRTPPGWTIAALSKAPHLRPVAAQFGATAVSLAAQSPGKVVSITDPDSGGMLLVGTELQPGQGVPILTRTPQFDLLPTGQGVAVSPRADSVALQAVPDGFVLTTAPAPLAVSRLDTDLLGDADALTRRFDFPALPAEQLTEQLAKHIAAAAALPPLARGPQRRAAALTMISLGMDAEAEALLQVTAGDDPREAESADVAGLTGIAALLAGRPAEAAGIDDPRLTGTDEILLWRALRVAILNPGSPQAAAALAATAPLLLTYPPAIRDKILPLAAETMVQGGATAAARELLAHAKGLPGLGLAQAMLSQASGNTGDALARYDTLAASRDAFVSARAARRAVELRLATGKLDKRQAAEALDRLLYAWRGDRRELALREELAKLREQLGEWHQALIMLRESETLFPDDAKAIHAQLQQAFEAGLQGGAADELPPLEFVALVDENADLIPNTGKGTAIEEKLADRLLALDLPEKAGPVLDKLMHAEPAGAVRAGLGLRLAALRLRDGDIDGALAAMNGSDAPDLPAPMNLQRTILRADAQARSGDVPGAIALLSKLDSVAAAGERATILERAKDWPGADRALADYVARTVPEAGDLTDDARRSLLRLATAAARAGDETTLAALRDRDQARMGTGPLADMFRLLTTEPVHGAADLSRSAREVGLAKALPSALQAMQPQVRTP
ncbi:MAG TPA: hypothetical protein VMB34_19330, partial [Acetobacteraceae bacterium]|nr:hypothetical protein [Acetobacteraceae bacterium]